MESQFRLFKFRATAQSSSEGSASRPASRLLCSGTPSRRLAWTSASRRLLFGAEEARNSGAIMPPTLVAVLWVILATSSLSKLLANRARVWMTLRPKQEGGWSKLPSSRRCEGNTDQYQVCFRQHPHKGLGTMHLVHAVCRLGPCPNTRYGLTHRAKTSCRHPPCIAKANDWCSLRS